MRLLASPFHDMNMPSVFCSVCREYGQDKIKEEHQFAHNLVFLFSRCKITQKKWKTKEKGKKRNISLVFVMDTLTKNERDMWQTWGGFGASPSCLQSLCVSVFQKISAPKMRGIGKNSIVYNYCAKRKQKHLGRTAMILRGVDDPVKGRLYVTVPVPAVFGGSPIHFWRPPWIFLPAAKNKRSGR